MHNESHCDGCGLKLPYAHILKGWINLADKIAQEESFLFLPYLFFKFFYQLFDIFWETPCSSEDHRDQMFCHSGGIPVTPCDEQTLFWYIEVLLTRRTAVNTSSVGFSSPTFAACYWKPWLQALWLFILSSLFLRRPSHDKAVGMRDKAGQKFHRRTANCQDDG